MPRNKETSVSADQGSDWLTQRQIAWLLTELKMMAPQALIVPQ
jgi:hypothetical protein